MRERALRNGRGHELTKTLQVDWMEQVLTTRAYIAGTYYCYLTADQFLFYLSRLLYNSSEVRQRLGPMLKERIVERFGAEPDSLSLASQDISACTVDHIGPSRPSFLRRVKMAHGRTVSSINLILIRNDGVTTALPIQEAEQL